MRIRLQNCFSSTNDVIEAQSTTSNSELIADNEIPQEQLLNAENLINKTVDGYDI